MRGAVPPALPLVLVLVLLLLLVLASGGRALTPGRFPERRVLWRRTLGGAPTMAPSHFPTKQPTLTPTSRLPSESPTSAPSVQPTRAPSVQPTARSSTPTRAPGTTLPKCGAWLNINGTDNGTSTYNKIAPKLGRNKKQCDKISGTCKASGVGLNWGPIGCTFKDGAGRVRRYGDGGCQCDQYCGYHCSRACNENKQCTWRNGACYNKANGFLGKPLLDCFCAPLGGTCSKTSDCCYGTCASSRCCSRVADPCREDADCCGASNKCVQKQQSSGLGVCQVPA